VHRRPHVQIEMTLLVGDVARREVEIESESGVVDQDADRPLAVGDASDDRRETVIGDEIRGQLRRPSLAPPPLVSPSPRRLATLLPRKRVRSSRLTAGEPRLGRTGRT